MATLCVLSGGGFQDSEGNVLANGYLKLFLNQDGTVAGSGNICSGVAVTVTLDANGNVNPSQSIWGNDVISPVNTFYRVTGYTAKGQPAWGPNSQQIVGATFNLSSWIPNQVIVWTPNTSAISLLHNGLVNSSQNRLNLKSTDNTVVITDAGGGDINLQTAGGATFNTAGQGFFLGAQSYAPVTESSGGPSGTGVPNQLIAVQLMLTYSITVSKLSIFVITGSGSDGFCCAGLYSADGNTKLIDAGVNAWDTHTNSQILRNSNITPVVLSPGLYWFAVGNVSATVGSVISHTDFSWFCRLLNGNVTRLGIAANGISGGAMPATLGAITPFTDITHKSVPAVLFQV